MPVTKFSALFESKDERVIHTISPPEKDISSVHNHVQNNKPKEPANEMYISSQECYIMSVWFVFGRFTNL